MVQSTPAAYPLCGGATIGGAERKVSPRLGVDPDHAPANNSSGDLKLHAVAGSEHRKRSGRTEASHGMNHRGVEHKRRHAESIVRIAVLLHTDSVSPSGSPASSP